MKNKVLVLFLGFTLFLQGQNNTTDPLSEKLLERTLDSVQKLTPFPNNTSGNEYGVVQMVSSLPNRIDFIYVTSKKMEGEKLKRRKIKSKSLIYNLAKARIDTLTGTVEQDQLILGINTNLQEGPSTLDLENNQLYFTRSVGKMGTNKEYQLNIFKTPFPVNQSKAQRPLFEINGNYSNMHPTFDAIEKTLYFSSDRPGGAGGMDLYKVAILEDGSLGKIENMGDEINSSSDEVFPYVLNENTLFYSRKRASENGTLDIWMAQLLPDQKWTTAQLKAPFLSENDDFGFSIDANSLLGFLSSNRENGVDNNYYFSYQPPIMGKEDRYRFNRDTLKVAATKGVLTNDQQAMRKNDPLQALISKQAILNQSTANGDLKLKEDGSFWYLAKQPLIEKDSFQYHLKSKLSTSKPITVFLEVEKSIEKPTALDFTIRPIYYEFNKSELWKKYQERFEEIVALLNRYPDLKLKIKAFTDARGSATYNQKLSSQRAHSIITYIQSKIEHQNYLESKGFGESTIEENSLKNYVLIGGGFKNEKNADALVSKFKKLGYPSTKYSISGKYSRVIISTFEYYQQAKELMMELKSKNISSFIDKSPAIKASEEIHQENRRVEFEVIK